MGNFILNSNIVFSSKEYEDQNHQQKQYRIQIEILFEWLKDTHRYEPLSDKRDADSLQREHKRLTSTRQQIDVKLNDIDTLLQNLHR